jgi:hypothetical protein
LQHYFQSHFIIEGKHMIFRQFTCITILAGALLGGLANAAEDNSSQPNHLS